MHQSAPSIRGKMITYAVGFVLSVILTLAAYFSVVNGLLSGRSLTLAIVGLAVVQLLVQLVFFLHLGDEKKPRHNLLAFGFTVLVVGIVVIGTLWVMEHLNAHMTTHEMEEHMTKHQGF